MKSSRLQKSPDLPGRGILIFLVSLLLITQSMHAQKKLLMKALHRFEINKKDTVWRFYAVIPPGMDFDNQKQYYGYSKDTIIITQGAVAERILHGSYTIFFPDKNLKETGQFEYGLKTGQWRSWYPGGIMKEKISWKKGVKEGAFEQYEINGNIISSGYYKNSFFTGFLQEMSPDGNKVKVFYNKGQIIKDKAAGEK